MNSVRDAIKQITFVIAISVGLLVWTITQYNIQKLAFDSVLAMTFFFLVACTHLALLFLYDRNLIKNETVSNFVYHLKYELSMPCIAFVFYLAPDKIQFVKGPFEASILVCLASFILLGFEYKRSMTKDLLDLKYDHSTHNNTF